MMPLWTPLARSVLWVVSWRIQTLLLIEDGKRITITCEECSVCPGYRGEFRDSDAGGYSFCAQSQLPSEGLGIVNTDKFCLIRLSTVELTLPLGETPGNTRLDGRKPNESSHLLFGSDTV